MYKHALIVSFLLLASLLASAQDNRHSLQDIWRQGLPYITKYEQQQYKADVQNWNIIQNNEGLIYAGNSGGILEYDGTYWRLIKTPIGNPIKSLAKDAHGTIYAGGLNELGFLETDLAQGKKFHSLVPLLDSASQNFGNVWFTLAAHDTIYFVCDHHILRWAGNKFRVWGNDVPLKIGFPWVIRGQVYVDIDGQGLMKFSGDTLTLVNGGQEFREKKISALMPYGDREFLAYSARDNTRYRFDGLHLVPFPEKNHRNPGARVYNAIQLSNGMYALATEGAGLYLLDSTGTIELQFTRKEGLTSNMVNGVYEDAEGDLWLATNNGINRIELNSPLRLLNEAHGLEEKVFDLAFFNNTLFAATQNGMLQLLSDPKSPSGHQPLFKKITGLDAPAWECKVIGNNLIVSSYAGLYGLDSRNRVTNFYKGFIPVVEYPARDANHFFFGTEENEIRELSFDKDSWKVGDQKIMIPGRPNEIVSDKDGNILITTQSGSLYEMSWSEEKDAHTLRDQYESIRYDSAHGLPIHAYNWLTIVDGIRYVSSPDKGLYRFDASTKNFTLDSVVTNSIRYKPAQVGTVIAAFGGGFWLPVYIGNETHLFKYEKDGAHELDATGRFSDLPFERILDQDKKIMVIASSDKGLILYNKDKASAIRSPVRTFIRKVLLGKDSSIYAGSIDEGVLPEFNIPHQTNGLRFQFSLLSYDLSSGNQYQYFLEGLDRSWSGWSHEAQADFTNVPEGDYTFHVRGKNIYGQTGQESTFSFSILPPWYRAWWAYAAYIAGFVSSLYAFVNWRTRRLKEEKTELEKVVEERTEEIRQQVEKLREMDILKSRFFANISHEFRTPLSLILAPVEEKLASLALSDTERESTLLVKRNAKRLLALINQLLDLSRLDAGKMELRIQQGNLEELLIAIAASFDSVAGLRKIHFSKNIRMEVSETWYDADKLEKILNNILINAFKFTPEGGTVKLHAFAKADSHELEIEVTDTGKGIPEEEQQHVFSPFYQSRHADDRSGTGLGLSLVKELVKLYGGTAELTSAVTLGTTIRVILPLTKEKFQPSAFADDLADLEVNSQAREEMASAIGADPEENIPDDAATSSDVDTVLVVEDNADLRNYIASVLEDRFRILMARSGEEALQLAAEYIPDLILSDVMMPGMNGIAFTQKIRADERTSHIPVILLTAKADDASRMEGLSAGADDYIAKPFYTEELRLRVTNLIGQRKKLAALFQAGISLHDNPLSMEDKFVQKIREIISENMTHSDFNVEMLAKQVHVSRSQLYRKMKSVTGFSPTEMITDLRLQKAASLILAKADTLSQIGYSVGFNDQSYFGKCFRKKFGVSPGEYATKA